MGQKKIGTATSRETGRRQTKLNSGRGNVNCRTPGQRKGWDLGEKKKKQFNGRGLACPLLHRYQGHVGASLIVGGVDLNGPQLYSVHPHGSYSRLPFTALGERFHPFHTNPASVTLPSSFVPQQLQLTSDAPSHLQALVRMQPWHCWRTGSSQT